MIEVQRWSFLGWSRYKCGSIVRGLSRRIKTMEAKMDILTSEIPAREFVEVRIRSHLKGLCAYVVPGDSVVITETAW